MEIGVPPLARKRGRGRILVLDDDPLLQEVVGQVLRVEGYAVTLADTLDVARQTLLRAQFDLVLSDGLGASRTAPPATRWAILEQIRDLAGATPVVIVTGREYELFADFAARGFRDVLLKPFTHRRLLSLVARHIRVADL
jgi:DNA-binding response OmpR family regulator